MPDFVDRSALSALASFSAIFGAIKNRGLQCRPRPIASLVPRPVDAYRESAGRSGISHVITMRFQPKADYTSEPCFTVRPWVTGDLQTQVAGITIVHIPSLAITGKLDSLR